MAGQKSKATGFSKGLISDVDPRYQLEGSYRDAMNVKLVNNEGTTFTIENINGNKQIVDLDNIAKDFLDSYGGGTSNVPDKYFQDIGGKPFDVGDSSGNNVPMRGAANIVGHFSFKNQLFLIVCGYIGYGETFGSTATEDFRTAFFLLDFNDKGEVIKCTDMRVAFNSPSNVNQFPNLNMDPLIKCRVEGIIENEAISRVYWTDNINPLRTLSLKDPDIHTMEPQELDIIPKSNHSQIVVTQMIGGNLRAGIYQYCYKYQTDTGAESGISPFSNMYHISNSNSQSYTTYSGSPAGEISTDGFSCKVSNLDDRYDSIKVFALYYPTENTPPLVGEIGVFDINDSNEAFFSHTSFNESIDDGVAQILIPSNTWDICKDIAIKDNVLFAANLRSKKNYISEKEWNVKILRYNIDSNQGMLTCNDDTVFDYYIDASTVSVYNVDDVVTGGSVRGNNANTSYTSVNVNSNNNHYAHRYLPTKAQDVTWSDGDFDGGTGSTVSDDKDRRVLGGASYGYYSASDGAPATNFLGGVQMSFRQVPKVADNIDNRGGNNDGSSVFFAAQTVNESIQTDNLVGSNGQTNNTNTEYVATMSMGANKDPMAAGTKRGYQRGETYRFGVLVYDLNGDPGNVLWMGDIQMPDHHDINWELDLDATQLGRDAANSNTVYRQNPLVQDYRLSSNGSAVVPGSSVMYDNSTDYSNHKQDPFTPEGIAGLHVTFDLAVDFTFNIPTHVREKISGFRVVRAERTESDRSILQSGLVNQTINYGDSIDQSNAYIDSTDATIFADPVEQGDTDIITADKVCEVYDTNLNGYVGISCGSNMVIGQASNLNRYLNECDAASNGNFHSHSGEFGSLQYYERATGPAGGSGTPYHRFSGFQRKVGVLYSPDSAFGVRPYSHRSESYIRVQSVLKLYDQRRYDHHDMNTNADGRLSWGYATTAYSNAGSAAIASAQNYGNLHFSTRKETDSANSAGVMVGKCYVFDTYYAHYITNYSNYISLSNSTGALYVRNHGSVSNDDMRHDNPGGVTTPTDNPLFTSDFGGGSRDIQGGSVQSTLRWITSITNSKEIGDGEFVGKGFFSDNDGNASKEFPWNRGFSNFALGKYYWNKPNEWKSYAKFGKNIDENDDYSSISTVQMGTRSILLYSITSWTGVKDIGYVCDANDFTRNKINNPLIITNNSTDHRMDDTYIPYYNYVNIVIANNGQYGGRNQAAINSTRWIIAGNYHPINVQNKHQHSTVFGGDTFVNLYSHQITTCPFPEKSFAKWLVFPVESVVNTDMRGGYHLGANDHIEGFDQQTPPFSNDWLYNTTYSQQNNLKSFLTIDEEDVTVTELPNEIAYSKTKLSGDQTDAFRVFPIFNFYDVEAIYGQINRIINYNNEIHFFQEKAFGQLLVNPRTFISDASGVQSLFTGSGDTIESHQYISVKYGTKHMHSVVASERNLYFFDVDFAKFLKYGTDKKLVSISDDLGTKDIFERACKYGRLKLEDRYHKHPRVSLQDMPLYFIGIHAGFDFFENTLYMTFLDRLSIDAFDRANYPTGKYIVNVNTPADGSGAYSIDPEDPNKVSQGAFSTRAIYNTTIAYSEDLDAVISKYSCYPQQWIQHQGSLYTPKSRLPWLSYDSNSDIAHGYHHSTTSSPVFGAALYGSYGSNPDFKYNMANYIFYSHELSRGSVQLWKWNDEDVDRTVYFDDVFLHAADDSSNPTDNTFDATIGYPLVMKVINSSTFLDDNGDYNGGLQLIDLGDANGTNVEFKTDSGVVIGEYNTTTQIVTIINDASLNLGTLLKSDAPIGEAKVIHKSYVEKVINDLPQENKKFDNLNVVSTVGKLDREFRNLYGQGNKLLTQRGVQSTDSGVYFESLEFVTDFVQSGLIDIATNDKPTYPTDTDFTDVLHKYREGVLRIPLRYSNVGEGESNPRITGTYLRVRVSARTTEKFNIFAILAKYRKSYN